MATATELEVSRSTGITVEDLQEIKRRRGADDDVLAALPYSVLYRQVARLRLPDLPLARAHYLSLRHRNAAGELPDPELVHRARTLAHIRRQAALNELSGQPSVPGSAQAVAAWRERGPGNIGGRTRCVVPDPKVPHLLYAGSVGGGIWRSTNDGASWSPVDDTMANLAICCLQMAPDGALFAGTGEGFGNMDALRGEGIFVSPNGSAWYQLQATKTKDFEYVNRLAITSDQIILAATLAGIMRSPDNGQTWIKAQIAPFTDVKAHPTDPMQAVAGTRDGRAYYTTDAGKTWRRASPNTWTGRVELAYSVADPSIVYASVNINNGEIWRSTDHGRTFSKRTTLSNGNAANYLGSQGWYDNVIWAGLPNDSDFVLVGGIDLWRSTDGGATLTRISDWWRAGSVHADHHLIAPARGFDGVANKAVYFGNDGGIFRADDVTTAGSPQTDSGWTKLNNGYAVTQFYYGAGNIASGQIVAGAQDNGTLSTTQTTGKTWFALYGGDGGACAADQSDPDRFFGEYVYLGIFRATGQAGSGEYIDGRFWNGSSWQRKPAPYNLADSNDPGAALFIAPFAIDPKVSHRILAGGTSLWRTNTADVPVSVAAGPLWEAIKKPIAGLGKISAIAIAPSNSDVVIIGYDNGRIDLSTDATTTKPTWKNELASRGTFCTSVAFDPTNTDIRYATFGGYGGNSVFAYDPAQTAWLNITPSGLELPCHAIAVHPVNTSTLYLGTDAGLWTSDDSGNTWVADQSLATTCAIFHLFWMGTTLVAVTHGRGVFSIDLASA